MRPPGVYQRIRELKDVDWNQMFSRPQMQLRADVSVFFDLSSHLWFMDGPLERVAERYASVLKKVDDKSQYRTGSDFEIACFQAIERLKPHLSAWTLDRIESASTDEIESLRAPLLEIPSTTLIGETGRDAHIEMLCWNRANCLLEDVISPYRAASGIARLSFYDPVRCLDLVGAFEPLVTQYEDYPQERAKLDQTITDLAREYVMARPVRPGSDGTDNTS